MTNQNLTSINVLIDESSSMDSLRSATIEGFNTFLQEQKKLPGKATLTVTKFNTRAIPLHRSIPLETAPELTEDTYAPGGCTALLDALGASVHELGSKLKSLKEEERPGKIVFLIITDGQENSSREYNSTAIKAMVEHQREKYSWEFVFLGANIDAFAAGAGLGIAGSNSISYGATQKGIGAVYSNVSAGLGAMRGNASYNAGDFFGRDLNSHSVQEYTGGQILVNTDGTLNEQAKVTVDQTVQVDVAVKVDTSAKP